MLIKKEFYPTPARLAFRVWKPFLYKKKGRSHLIDREIGYHVADLSAGVGNLLLPVNLERSYRSNNYRNLDSLTLIEIDPELHTLLVEKNKEAILGDSLNMDFSNRYFNLIVINPPFSNGDEHCLKAWEILSEGDLVCILNQDTIINPYTARRKLLTEIIRRHGTVEFVEAPFYNAERTTGVDVAIVRLKKKERAKTFNFTFESSNEEYHTTNGIESSLDDSLQRASAITAKVRQVNKAVEAFKEFLTAFNKVDFYLMGISNIHDMTNKFEDIDFKDKGISSFQNFCKRTKLAAWNNIFNLPMFTRLLTNGIREEFDITCAKMGSADFTEENVMNFFRMIFENHSAIMDKAVLDVFDRLVKYDKLNSTHVEGWKTNDAFRVNERVIMPYAVSYSNYSGRPGGGYFSFNHNYRTRGFLDDMDKVLCRFKGLNYAEFEDEEKELEKANAHKTRLERQNLLPEKFFRRISTAIEKSFSHPLAPRESYFFEFKFYQKGTLHLRFKDKKLLAEFNLKVAQVRNWLPHDYDKKGL